jgi:molecular chaperone GrpE
MAEKDQRNDERAPEEEVLEEAEAEAKESGELRERLLRMAAEFDNYKKRVAKDIEGSKDLGHADVIARLLPIVDEFELALGALGKDEGNHKGVAMIYSNFVGILKGFGLKEIDARGKADPFRHEVVLTRESDREDGTIIEVVRKGYTINNVMLRPSSVIIAKKDTAGKNEKSG